MTTINPISVLANSELAFKGGKIFVKNLQSMLKGKTSPLEVTVAFYNPLNRAIMEDVLKKK